MVILCKPSPVCLTGILVSLSHSAIVWRTLAFESGRTKIENGVNEPQLNHWCSQSEIHKQTKLHTFSFEFNPNFSTSRKLSWSTVTWLWLQRIKAYSKPLPGLNSVFADLNEPIPPLPRTFVSKPTKWTNRTFLISLFHKMPWDMVGYPHRNLVIVMLFRKCTNI